MKMYDLHKIPSNQVNLEPEFNAPVNQSIDFPDVDNKMSNSRGSVKVNQDIDKFPWGEVLIWGGLTIFAIYGIVHLSKNNGYGGGFRRRRTRREK